MFHFLDRIQHAIGVLAISPAYPAGRVDWCTQRSIFRTSPGLSTLGSTTSSTAMATKHLSVALLYFQQFRLHLRAVRCVFWTTGFFGPKGKRLAKSWNIAVLTSCGLTAGGIEILRYVILNAKMDVLILRRLRDATANPCAATRLITGIRRTKMLRAFLGEERNVNTRCLTIMRLSCPC